MPNISSSPVRSDLRNGLIGWTAIAIVLVVIRGVRWDENYEFAQVITGQIPYPPGHPLYQYTRSFFSLQPWSLAGLMQIAPGPLLANGLRNVMMLWATVLPAYALTLAIARKPVFAHTVVLLTLMGIHTEFFSNYPVQIWPDIYSNGHVGQGWALMTLALWLLGRNRAAWLLLGFMPAVHLGQLPPVALYAGWRLAEAFFNGKYRDLGLALRWMMPGLFASVALWIFVQWITPETESWSADVSSASVLQGYLEHIASHRALPDWTGHLPLAMLLLLAFTVNAPRAIKYYAAGVAALAWGIGCCHWMLGPATPEFLLRWMPYRILNHAAPVLIALSVGILARNTRAGTGVIAALLVAGLLRPLLGYVLPASIHERYLDGGEAWFFLLAGSAFAAPVLTRENVHAPVVARVVAGAITMFSILLLASHQFGAAMFLSGLLLVSFCAIYLPQAVRLDKALPVLCPALLLVIGLGEFASRAHLPRSGFERQVSDILSSRDKNDAMLLVPYQQESMQARTGHPVMTDMATLTWIPYKPALAPGLWKMYRELYGIDVAPGLAPPLPPLAWHEVWPSKSRKEWAGLAGTYGFEYVVAPGFMDLPLDVMLSTGDRTLYHVFGDKQ